MTTAYKQIIPYRLIIRQHGGDFPGSEFTP